MPVSINTSANTVTIVRPPSGTVTVNSYSGIVTLRLS